MLSREVVPCHVGDETIACRPRRGRISTGRADVSERTRIRATVMREIEADNFSHCGGDVYARGHLRSIATAVGLDADAVDRGSSTPSTRTVPSAAAEVFEAETITRAAPWPELECRHGRRAGRRGRSGRRPGLPRRQ